MNTIFDFYPANIKTVGIISIPHSGEVIPDIFKNYLSSNLRDLAEDVDYAVFELLDFDRVRDAGISILQAKIHRTCVDLNRPPETAVLNWKCNSQGVKIVVNEPTDEMRTKLEKDYYRPYFDFLRELIRESKVEKIPVLDFHSMPSRPTPYHLKQNPDQATERPSFCLSDLRGLSCDSDFISYAVQSFKNVGYIASTNDPYYGGYLTKFINQFDTNNIQIETNRSIYMDEVERTLKVDKVKILRPKVTEAVIDIILKFS